MSILQSLLSMFGNRSPGSPSLPPDPSLYDHYTGSLVEGNYVWSGAMNLCWTELCASVIKEPVRLNSKDAAALAMTEHLNHPVCGKQDLDALSYYVKAGFGPKTLQAINKECKAKFPQKSFGDLDFDLADDDIVSYAYFYKNVRYEKPFTVSEMVFDNKQVKGFEAKEAEKRTVEVLSYESDDKFIIRLRLKDQGDELLLAKGYDTQYPGEMLSALAASSSYSVTRLGDDDHFKMPVLKLNIKRDYAEMIGQHLANKNFTEYLIGLMFENITFALDETGAKVESQAVIGLARGAYSPNKKDRYFYLNKPFWVIMKRADSSHPYFLLGVSNAHFMQPN